MRKRNPNRRSALNAGATKIPVIRRGGAAPANTNYLSLIMPEELQRSRKNYLSFLIHLFFVKRRLE